MARRLGSDGGSILPMALVIMAGLSVVVLSFIGAQEGWAVRRDAQLAAEAAARAGAQVSPDGWRADQATAPAAGVQAQTALTAQGYTGSVHVTATEVVVTVVAPITHTFPMPWLPSRTQATARVQLIRGVDGTRE